jgi:hypothetical protein
MRFVFPGISSVSNFSVIDAVLRAFVRGPATCKQRSVDEASGYPVSLLNAEALCMAM